MKDMTLGQRIAALRKEKGLTQEALADRLKVTSQAVSKWENDVSCPDITLIPKLAEIFSVSCDVILGNEEYEANKNYEKEEYRTVTGEVSNTHQNCSTGKNCEFNIKPELGFPLFIILFGLGLLLRSVYSLDASIWQILLSSGLIGFGIGGMFSSSFFFSSIVTLFGLYLGLRYFDVINKFQIGFELVIAIILLAWGIYLVIKSFTHKKKDEIIGSNYSKHKKEKFEFEEGNLYLDLCFGEKKEVITSVFKKGDIDVSFGAATIEFDRSATISSPAHLDIDCSFGNVKVLVPSNILVLVEKETAFADIKIKGNHDDITISQLNISADCSFGEIDIIYI